MSTRSGPPRARRPAVAIDLDRTVRADDERTPDRETTGARDDPAFRLTVPAQAEQIPAVRQAVRRFAERHRVARPIDVALAVSEACANVVVHAYVDQPSCPLHVTGVVERELVCVTVADEGSGLAPRLDSPGMGLGLPIIARVTDHFQISERRPAGTLVTMRFAQTPAPEREAYLQIRDDLATALREGVGLDTIESRIQRAPLSADARDALWLAAWATVAGTQPGLGPPGQRRVP